jgi:hypothetical protein
MPHDCADRAVSEAAGCWGSPAPKTEPIESGRSDDLVQDLQTRILKVDQGASSGMAAHNHSIRDALSNFVAVFVCRYLFADVFQGSRHICDRVLIKFCQQFALRLPIYGPIEIGKAITAPSGLFQKILLVLP